MQNTVLIISGSLVGAAGIILTTIMCKAMNRSLLNVMFSSMAVRLHSRSFALTVCVALLAACKTVDIGPPLNTPVPSNLTQEETEIAIVAMLSAPLEEVQADPNTKTLVIASPLGAMLWDHYRRGRSPRKKSWFLESWDPGLLYLGYLGYRRGLFYMRVAIKTGVPTFSLRIVESRNLDQTHGRIHKNAKVWVGNLEADIRRALGHASLAKRTLANQDYD